MLGHLIRKEILDHIHKKELSEPIKADESDRIANILNKRDAAVQGALKGITLRQLVEDSPMDSRPPPIQES